VNRIMSLFCCKTKKVFQNYLKQRSLSISKDMVMSMPDSAFIGVMPGTSTYVVGEFYTTTFLLFSYKKTGIDTPWTQF
jgi:hypothetical protein